MPNTCSFLARLLVEEGVKALQAVGLAQHQVHRHFDVQALAQLLQARADFLRQVVDRRLAPQQGVQRHGDHHAVERAVAPAQAQLVEQHAPGAAVDLAVGLVEEAPGGVHQHGLFGEVPVAKSPLEGSRAACGRSC
jgi:hypothetical protein